MTARTRVVCETCGWSEEYAGGTMWTTHGERIQKAQGGHTSHCENAEFSTIPLLETGETA